MSIPFVDLKAQYESIKAEVDGAIASVINQTSFIGGEIVNQFESDFASYIGTNHCIGVANGTDAIEIALKALGIGEGDEVLVPAITWVATAGAVKNVGAEPVFIDVLEKERTIDPSLVEEKVTSKTKAIIPVHLYGLPARMEEIIEVAKKHDLKIIEDCAQAHGAEVHGRRVGTIGDIATFSFYPGKNLGAYGDAGAVVTSDKKLAEISRMLSNHGQLQKHHHKIIGRNSRLDSMQAAILSAKLPYLEKWISARIQVSKWYDERLTSVQKPIIPENFRHVFHLYVIQSQKRDLLMNKLKDVNIGCAIHYPTALPHMECFQYLGYKNGDFPVAEKLSNEILSLPIFPEMAEEEVDWVCEILNNQ